MTTIVKTKTTSNPLFSLKILETNKTSPPKVTLVVSGKTCNKAVKRNLLKRRTRSIIQKNKEKLKGGKAYFFYFKKGAEAEKFDILKQNIISALNKT